MVNMSRGKLYDQTLMMVAAQSYSRDSASASSAARNLFSASIVTNDEHATAPQGIQYFGLKRFLTNSTLRFPWTK